MIFTLYYMYLTNMQCRKIMSLRNKLNGTLNSHNALMVQVGNTISNSRKRRYLENLLFHKKDRVCCTIVPKQKINLNQWALFPNDLSYFPIFISDSKTVLTTPKIYLLLQAELNDYKQHDSEIIQVEHFGELVAWRAQDQFEIILETDLNNLAKFVNCFYDHSIDINHELKLLRIETINVEGNPLRIKYDLKYSLDTRLKYSLAPVHWNKFTSELKSLYLKSGVVFHNSKLEHPTITIESSSSKAVPISKVIPIIKSLESTNRNKLKANGVQVNTKPPNVLVYSDSIVAKDNVKKVLYTTLNRQKYTVYDFPTNTDLSIWYGSTCLIVVCGNVPPNISIQLLQYLVDGGKLLCLCSDLLYSVLHIFSTAEVRERELVRFSYENWKRVKMMHHILCYQASPAKRQFSKDSDQSNSSRGSSPVAPHTPSAVEIHHKGKKHTVQVQVLAAEETWHTPSLLLATVKHTPGIAIFSQVHLEIDPTQYQDDESKFSALTESNAARLEILKHLLSHHLSLDCNSVTDVTYTPGYLLGNLIVKRQLLSKTDAVQNNQIVNSNVTIKFFGNDVEFERASDKMLPLLIHACPSNFSTVKYYDNLSTNSIGQILVYTDVISSTQSFISTKLVHGFAIIARQQTQGIGRSGNIWLSPLGSAMFSLQLHVPLQSPLGLSLSLLQHIVMVSVVDAVRQKVGYEGIQLGIKWPNDLYANGTVKVGGVLVNTSVHSNKAIVNIGCGINLDNSEPTTCINNLIRNYDSELKPIMYEDFFAIVFNALERMYNSVQSGNLALLFELYYKYWLHSNAEVVVTASNGQTCTATIIGIDEFGFLKVRCSDGTVSSVQPDGNSFDMLKGLILPKACQC